MCCRPVEDNQCQSDNFSWKLNIEASRAETPHSLSLKGKRKLNVKECFWESRRHHRTACPLMKAPLSKERCWYWYARQTATDHHGYSARPSPPLPLLLLLFLSPFPVFFLLQSAPLKFEGHRQSCVSFLSSTSSSSPRMEKVEKTPHHKAFPYTHSLYIYSPLTNSKTAESSEKFCRWQHSKGCVGSLRCTGWRGKVRVQSPAAHLCC